MADQRGELSIAMANQSEKFYGWVNRNLLRPTMGAMGHVLGAVAKGMDENTFSGAPGNFTPALELLGKATAPIQESIQGGLESTGMGPETAEFFTTAADVAIPAPPVASVVNKFRKVKTGLKIADTAGDLSTAAKTAKTATTPKVVGTGSYGTVVEGQPGQVVKHINPQKSTTKGALQEVESLVNTPNSPNVHYVDIDPMSSGDKRVSIAMDDARVNHESITHRGVDDKQPVSDLAFSKDASDKTIALRQSQESIKQILKGELVLDRHVGNVMVNKMTGRPYQLDVGVTAKLRDKAAKAQELSYTLAEGFSAVDDHITAEVLSDTIWDYIEGGQYDEAFDIAQQGVSKLMKIKRVSQKPIAVPRKGGPKQDPATLRIDPEPPEGKGRMPDSPEIAQIKKDNKDIRKERLATTHPEGEPNAYGVLTDKKAHKEGVNLEDHMYEDHHITGPGETGGSWNVDPEVAVFLDNVDPKTQQKVVQILREHGIDVGNVENNLAYLKGRKQLKAGVKDPIDHHKGVHDWMRSKGYATGRGYGRGTTPSLAGKTPEQQAKIITQFINERRHIRTMVGREQALQGDMTKKQWIRMAKEQMPGFSDEQYEFMYPTSLGKASKEGLFIKDD